ncbi:hypothetical protein IWQ60_003142 [Tieghemiomyces parasiticus]|uniref:Uncharacterized protein n=1 Tax=Tieghemiomyces parasiticus TaxID=78921 RepID=A0A9W8DV22_9FUNG|nr:hypothetical protein IWQ60_003142 [Tieghemiomyces parasiticus]
MINLLAYFTANFVILGLSLLCSIISIFLILWVWHKKPLSKESPSFSLALWISFADFPLRIIDVLTNPLAFGQSPPPMDAGYARFLTWFNMFSLMWFIALNAMIVLDLQLVIFHRLPRHARIRSRYPAIAAASSAFFSVWYLILPDYRFLENGTITVSSPGSPAQRFFLLWFTIWLPIILLYMVGVVAAILITLFRTQAQLRRFALDSTSRQRSQTLLRNARLIIAYPILCTVLFVPYAVGQFQAAWDAQSSLDLTLFINFLFSLQGVANLVILLFHPVMLSAYRHNLIGLPSFLSTQASASSGLPSNGLAFAGTKPVDHHLKSLDMGPAVTCHFGTVMEKCATTIGDETRHSAVDIDKASDPVFLSMMQSSGGSTSECDTLIDDESAFL